MGTVFLNHNQVVVRAQELADKIKQYHRPIALYGIPRGGVPVAYLVSGFLPGSALVNHPGDASFFVDDLEDSGATREHYTQQFPDRPFLTLVQKDSIADSWYVFPWEQSEEGSAEDIPKRLLQFIGEDLKREGLLDTPRRFLEAWKFWAGGYGIDPATLLKSFEDGAENTDEMIFVGSIPFTSHCEHHLAQFSGVVHFAYIPNGRIVGLSKIPRLVDIYARRLQVQERMTTLIAENFWQLMKPRGVGVVVHAEHTCISSRGVRAHNIQTITSKLLGVMLEKPSAKEEFFRLIALQRG